MDPTRPAALVAVLLLAGCEAEPPAPEAPVASEAAAAPEPARAPAPAAPAPASKSEAAPAPASAPAAAQAWSPRGYRLVGTEPFWGGTVASGRVLYQTPENESGEPVAVSGSLAPAREVYSGTLAGAPFVLTLTSGPCSDGMSDNVHAFTAELVVAGETRHGCANPR